ncbi:MAG: hypothetical protein COU46_01670 [Candidatus Niyogibacteria bacterium CG10_big_fil_rev_8_21_14_0_10_42_19]|uniref:Uncharacterized protein n=1 Tax=Candidatus Niyogibacteria bacterium CG10_big_fil_rev_8_21_14_0_10_42_19 TaxID=1974725 RepID=A0A2H0TFW1_9BACT|nr:MAG: hypothetical protein COU46_01670 [Candidatus Niyogibacteria bacterium CG10_big_fil_rev_8_21_14_0_10_42_19]
MPEFKYNPDPKASKKLHSREHVLADDLSKMMGEPKRFSAYLGISIRYPEEILRRIASEVLESYKRDHAGKINCGKLFFYKVGQLRKDKK